MESKSKKSKKTTKSIGIITEPKSVKSSVVSSSIIKIASVRSAHVGKGSARSEIVATNMVSPNTVNVEMFQMRNYVKKLKHFFRRKLQNQTTAMLH